MSAETPLSNPLQRLTRMQQESNDTERKIAAFVLENLTAIPSWSISEFAQRVNVSETTVVRFCRALGYNGYREFRMEMAQNAGALRASIDLGTEIPADLSEDDSLESIAKKVIRINAEVLVDTINLIDFERLEKAISMILSAQRAFLFGFGSSTPVVYDAYQRFLRLGIRAVTSSDPHIITSMIVNAVPGDLVLGVSFSGASADLVDAFETARELGAGTIAITSYPGSPITKYADVTLYSAVRRAPIPTESIASRISQLALIDVICAAIGIRRSGEAIPNAELFYKKLARKRVGTTEK